MKKDIEMLIFFLILGAVIWAWTSLCLSTANYMQSCVQKNHTIFYYNMFCEKTSEGSGN